MRREQRTGSRMSLRTVAAVALAGALLPLHVLGGTAGAADPCTTPANPVVAENCLPGSPASAWDVPGTGDASIRGFASQFSVDHGSTVHFAVDTDASAYRIDVYRLGWYGGNGARFVATVNPSASLPQAQPACLNDATTGLVDCGNWAESASWAVPANAASGIYVGKLVRTDATPGASHIYFVVRDDARHSEALFQTSDTTWQAYNTYGGNSLYAGAPAGRAYKVSYNRPFDTRATAPESFLFNAEFPMLRWLERNGYDLSYASGSDVDRDAAALQHHKTFLSVGQDEYWSGAQRANVEAARDAGVNLAFFSGNESFWKTRWEPSIDGSASPRRTLVSYKETHANAKIDPNAAWTGTWRDTRFSPPSDGGRPENALSGTIFTVNSGTTSVQVPPADNTLRMWRNTPIAGSASVATLGSQTLGYEWDEDLDNGSRPPGQIRLSSTTTPVPERLQDLGSTYAAGVATHSLTLHRSGTALVFGAGTVQWAWGLDGTHDRGATTPSVVMQQATVNLLADMGTQPGTLQAGLVAASASADTTAPSATVTGPAGGTVVPSGSAVTVTGTATDSGGRVGGVEVSTDNGSTWHPAAGHESWSYTFTPATTGNRMLKARATDDSANLGSASSGVPIVVSAAACPCSIWNSTATPANDAANDTQSIEVGVKFSSEVDGQISALRFYKGAANTGTHVGHLWAADGTLLATATFTGETASGWQEVALSPSVPITAGTDYVASYFSPTGYFAFDGGAFDSAGVDNPPLHVPTLGARFSYGGGFPSGGGPNNYWVDVVLDTGPDTTPPTITSRAPAPSTVNVPLSTAVTATFGEPVDVTTVNGSTVSLRDASNVVVPAAVAYAANTRTATLTPSAPLLPSTTYTATVKGGSGGVTDVAHNQLAADVSWTFDTAPPPADSGPGGPILVIGSTGNSFGRYLGEILRAEGLDEYRVTDIANVNPGVLAPYQVVLLGDMSLSAAQVTMLSNWVNAGGNLIAMRPDAQLAPLLGLSSSGGTLANKYLKVTTGSHPGAGITGQTIQFHGTADKYTLSGATSVATLYSDATTATPNPAVTLRSVGTSGGQVAAFTYDLARSVVYTRQGNPAWAGQERDGQPPIRSDDLFFGASASDPQPDWVDLGKVQIPQADEQQRLLANMVLEMDADKTPLPRFWYLPHGKKAAVVMSGDDHGGGGTAGRFDGELAASAPGCSLLDWECVRSTSYLYVDAPLTDAQAAGYEAQGFEVAAHVDTGCVDWTPASLDANFTDQFATWHAKYSSAPAPSTNRTHCIVWSDYSTQPHVELAHGVRLDASYYYWPQSWIQDRPGVFTGSAIPMRFADPDGSLLDVYQATTQMTDESGQSYPATINSLLDNAVGSNGYYGVYTANMHTDNASSGGSDAIIASAKARGVPVVSARQMLTWLDGRDASSFGGLGFSGNVLTFTVDAAAGARGIQGMVPAVTGAGAGLTTITRGGTSVPFTIQTIKGESYAFFDAASGSYSVTYAADITPPAVSAVTATASPAGTATVTWATDEPASSRVSYGTAPNALTSVVNDPALVTAHSTTLSGLVPGRSYSFRVTSTDAAGNSTTAPAPPAAPSGFTVPTFAATDTTTANFSAGTAGGCGVTAHVGDGELTLSPATGTEFSGTALPANFESVPWSAGGTATVGSGQLTVDGARVDTPATVSPGRSLEFTATFTAGPFQHVGFGDTLNSDPWAIFSTGSDGLTLKARTNSGGQSNDEVITGNWLGAPHRFRVDWRASSVVYSIDGTVVTSHPITISAPMRPIASDGPVGGPGLSVDWLALSPYASPCQFVSRAFDAAATAQWSTLDRVVTAPAATSAGFETRTSPDASTWSAWTPVSGSAIGSPNGRYLQYRATLSATDATLTPTLQAVTVSAKAAPTTTMALPQNNSSIAGSKTLAASASASATRVEFRATGAALTDQVIGAATSTIYGWLATWNTTTFTNATYSVSAVAYDAGNVSGRSAPFTITVDNAAPTGVAVSAPAANASLTGSKTLSANASDNVGVTKVEFRVTGGSLNDAIVGTGTRVGSVWNATWNTAPLNNGSYSLTALASDAAGNTTRSAAVPVKIDKTAPSAASVLSPTANASLAGTKSLLANASDNVAVTKLEFRVTGGTLSDAVVGTAVSTQYGWAANWNTAGVVDGAYSLTALAYDAAGNTRRSPAVPVKVDNTAPSSVSVLSPGNGATVTTSASLLAGASDNVAVTKVEFRATGGTLVDAVVATGSSTSYGWFATWNTGAAANGAYSLVALAYDAAGNSKRSAAVSISVAH